MVISYTISLYHDNFGQNWGFYIFFNKLEKE